MNPKNRIYFFFVLLFISNGCAVKLYEEKNLSVNNVVKEADPVCLLLELSTSYTSMGSGSESDPYLICNAEQLNSIGDNALSSHFKLMSNIDLVNYDGVAPNPSFSIIGSTLDFTGSFDGNGYMISNFSNLFLYTKSATIKNFVFENYTSRIIYSGDDITLTGITLRNATGVLISIGFGIFRDILGEGLTTDCSMYCSPIIGRVVANYPASFKQTKTIISNIRMSNIIITASSMGAGGVVGYSDGGFILRDVEIRDLSISSTGANNIGVGGVLGRGTGVFENVRIYGDGNPATYEVSNMIGASQGTGGLIGYADEGTIILDSSSTVDVEGKGQVGGLVGWLMGESIVSRSFATGRIEGTDRAGGLIGYTHTYLDPLTTNGRTLIVTDSYATGDVYAPASPYVGGLIGQLTHAIVYRSYATGNVEGTYQVGGLVGVNWKSDTLYSFSTGNVIGHTTHNGMVGRIIGRNDAGTLTGNYFNGNSSLTNTLAGTLRAPTAQETAVDVGGVSPADYFYTKTNAPMTNWDFTGSTADGSNNVWEQMAATYPQLRTEEESGYVAPFSGEGTLDNPYLISTAAELNSIGSNYHLMKKVFKITQAFDLSGYNGVAANPSYLPIGSTVFPFMGTFIGDRHAISNLTITTTNYYMGFFSVLVGATITGLNLTTAKITTNKSYAGLIGAYAAGTYLGKSSVTGDGTAAKDVLGNGAMSDHIGGLFGYSRNRDNYIEDCFAKSLDVQGLKRTGGFSSMSNGGYNIKRSYFTGSVVGTDQVGGLLGKTGLSGGQHLGTFVVAPVTGNTTTNNIGRTILGTLFGISQTYFDDTQTLVNNGTGSTSSAGIAVNVGGTDPADYFFDSSSAVFNVVGDEWDFTNVWLENPADYPSLR